jgi:hypothetical protein
VCPSTDLDAMENQTPTLQPVACHHNFFKFPYFVMESELCPLGTSATNWPIVPSPVDCEDGELGGMNINRENRSTRRKADPVSLCPPQIPLAQSRGEASD